MIDYEIVNRIFRLRRSSEVKLRLIWLLTRYKKDFPNSSNFNRLVLWKFCNGDKKQIERVRYLNQILQELGYISVRSETHQEENGQWTTHTFVKVLV